MAGTQESHRMYQGAEACQILESAATKSAKYPTKTLVSIGVLPF